MRATLDKMVHNTKEVTKMEFTHHTVSLSTGNSQPVIVVALPTSLSVFSVIKLYASDDMYNKGLQKNYKNLVDMEEVAGLIAGTLNAYTNVELLNEETWDRIIGTFEPFICACRKWTELTGLNEGAKW